MIVVFLELRITLCFTNQKYEPLCILVSFHSKRNHFTDIAHLGTLFSFYTYNNQTWEEEKVRSFFFFNSSFFSFSYHLLTFFLLWRLQIKRGRKERYVLFSFLLVLLCLIPILYFNLLFAVAASNQSHLLSRRGLLLLPHQLCSLLTLEGYT